MRYIEVQVAGDGQGQAIQFRSSASARRSAATRKSLKRRPAGLPEPPRQAILADAVKLAASVEYRGLGTVEFRRRGRRILSLKSIHVCSIEHPVTEEVTGLDLVAL